MEADRTSVPGVLNFFIGCVRVSLCLACSKHFLSFQPVIYKENISEERVELKYLILPAAHHYSQICFTGKTGCSVIWVGWTQFEAASLHSFCPQIICLLAAWQGPAFMATSGPRRQLSPWEWFAPVTLHGAGHFPHTHKKGFLPVPFVSQEQH